MNAAPYIPLDALAATLKLPRPWLRKEADAGRIPHLKIGRRRLFQVQQVQEALAERAANGEPQTEAATAGDEP